MASVEKQPNHENRIITALHSAGYMAKNRICNTLQGEIWLALDKTTRQRFVVKATSKRSHNTKAAAVQRNGQTVAVQENIVQETAILKHLSSFTTCPSSIIQYRTCFQTASDYFLVMEYGGSSVFDFVVKAHKLMQDGVLNIANWKQVTKVIFKQMMEAVAFMHSKNIIHFDISMENLTLLNDLEVEVRENDTSKETITFIDIEQFVQVKIIDFGLAERFAPNASVFLSNKYCGKRNYQCPEIVARQRVFDAAANDVWCCGVCLFMMTTGTAPFHVASETDECYRCIMNGQMTDMLRAWKKLQYLDADALHLLSRIFQRESQRITVAEILKHRWMKL
mmetsp:Transcript_66646/g.105917  ORF Transcript_66646/g.105917 Transcript_66646/m.105917 type:complete len:337 (-) Transcript_66646:56-1066(-)